VCTDTLTLQHQSLSILKNKEIRLKKEYPLERHLEQSCTALRGVQWRHEVITSQLLVLMQALPGEKSTQRPAVHTKADTHFQRSSVNPVQTEQRSIPGRYRVQNVQCDSWDNKIKQTEKCMHNVTVMARSLWNCLQIFNSWLVCYKYRNWLCAVLQLTFVNGTQWRQSCLRSCLLCERVICCLSG
jgi:hypothetical protein